MRYAGSIAFALLAALVSPLSQRGRAAESNPGATTPAAEPAQTSLHDEPADALGQRAEQLWLTYSTATFNSLTTSSNPRDWLLATLVNPWSEQIATEQHQTALLDRAVAAAPDDLLVQWIALRRAPQSDTRRDILRNLERMEPENAAVWMEVLMQASRRKDQAAIDSALMRMAASKRNDEHLSDFIKAQLDIFKRYPFPDEYFTIAVEQNPELSQKESKETVPYTAAMAVASAFGLPAYQPLVQACTVNSQTGKNAARANDCKAIGRMLVAHATVSIDSRIGSAVLRRSHTFDDDDVQRARTQDWIWQQRVTLYGDPTHQPPAEEIIATVNDWIETGSEFESVLRALARAGKSMTPPPDWIDTQSPFSAERLHDDQLAAAHAAAEAH